MEFQNKQRIIQEFVPGKQVTMAHLIANPDGDIYKKLGGNSHYYAQRGGDHRRGRGRQGG